MSDVLPDEWVTFLFVVTKIPDKKQLRWGEVYSVPRGVSRG